MRIRITTDLPVAKEIRPVIGSVFEVTRSEPRGRETLYFIRVGDAPVGVFSHECQVLQDTEQCPFPGRETVEQLRKEYPERTRVVLEQMDDPYTDLKPGDMGTVKSVDDAGTIFVRWDNGSGLGIVYGVDRIRKL